MGRNGRLYFFGALGGLLFGYDTGVISGAILFIKEDFNLGPFLEGAVVAVLLLGALVGAAISGRLSDGLGRRRIVLAAGVIFAVGALLAAVAPNTAVLLLARFALGLAVGCAALIVPLYLSEIAPTEQRGAVSSLNQLMIVTGILVAFVVNAIFAGSESWRIMLGLGVLPAIALLAGITRLPESPRWLVSKGREDEAREVLGRTRDEAGVEEELEQIRRVEEAEEEVGGFKALSAPWLRPALIVAIGLAVLQQLVGINTIIYYAPTTLTNVGYDDQAAIYANIIIGVLNLAATLVAIRYVDKVGRKPLLVFGLFGMITALAVLGLGSLALGEPSSPGDPLAILTLVCLGAFIVSFAATWGPVVWVVLPEVLPLGVRGAAMGLAISLHWAANFGVSQTFPPLIDSVGPGPVFLGYAIIGVLALAFVRAFFTETKGRSLEAIEADLHKAFDSGGTSGTGTLQPQTP